MRALSQTQIKRLTAIHGWSAVVAMVVAMLAVMGTIVAAAWRRPPSMT